jgi:hypothetical protein
VKFYKLISVFLYPNVIPTLGVMFYFLTVPVNFESKQKMGILSLVFVVTYLFPLLISFIFKKIKLIDSYRIESIRQRKLPIALMFGVFYLLGNTISYIPNFHDLALLFFSTSLGLIIIYFLFYFKIKASIHLFSLGVFMGFFLVLSTVYQQSFLIIIIAILFLSGILANARLQLKAHTTKEIYLGFFIGIIAPIIGSFIL